MQTQTLMQQYVGTVNRAIEQNQDRFPYRQMIDVSDRLIDQLDLQVAVYKDDPATPHDYFTLRWDGRALEIAGHGKENGADLAWKVPQGHLVEVVENPGRFVQEPAKLDLDWLGRRIGIA